MVYDCVVIGGGPAGVSAALNLKILGKSFIWLCSDSGSKKAASAELVRNYPGLPDVTGGEFVQALSAHASAMDIRQTKGVVTAIYDLSSRFALAVGEDTFEARTIILCTGVSAAKQIEGEAEFLGRGVSYCATCDGFLYKGKTIGVLATDKNFEHEAAYLATLAAKVYYMPMYKGCALSAENCEILVKMPKRIYGGMKVQGVEFADGNLMLDGLFILRSSVAPQTLLKGLKTDGGHIVADRGCATSVAGVFAAGDCTGRPYQYAKAVGEGNVAAHSVVDYLANLDKKAPKSN